jgi:hypothetical protein
MRKRIASAVLATATLLAGAAHAAALDKKETINLDRAAVVGRNVLPSGSYKIELASDPDTVRFLQAGKTVAEAPCKLGLAAVVYPGNAVHFRTAEKGPDRLTKIVLAGSKIAIEIPAPAGVEADAPIAKGTDRP